VNNSLRLKVGATILAMKFYKYTNFKSYKLFDGEYRVENSNPLLYEENSEV